MHDDIFLQCRGTDIVTRSRKKVMLKGVGLGGCMNMENFITGYPATETLQREALKKALGEEGYHAFFLIGFWMYFLARRMRHFLRASG